MKTGFHPLTLPFLCLFRTMSPKSTGQGHKLKEVETSCPGKQNHKSAFRGFPGGSGVKNPPANAGETGSIPDPGRPHCRGATQPTRCNFRACAWGEHKAPQPERLGTWENERTEQNPSRKAEKPGEPLKRYDVNRWKMRYFSNPKHNSFI